MGQFTQSASKEADMGPGQLTEDGFPSRSGFNSSKGFKADVRCVFIRESAKGMSRMH